MGGIIILLAILIPTLLFADINKVYVRLMLLCTVWLGFIGFLDDYLKLRARKKAQERGEKYQKKDSHGLAGLSKITGQIGLGIIIGVTLYFNSNVVVERELQGESTTAQLQRGERLSKDSNVVYDTHPIEPVDLHAEGFAHRDGADITSQLFTPNGFMRVDADYLPKPYEMWRGSDWPSTYQALGDPCGLRVVNRGLRQLKGKSQRIRVYSVLGWENDDAA